MKDGELLLDDFTYAINQEIGNDYHKLLEHRIQLVLRKKPVLLPRFAWKWLIKNLIYTTCRRMV